MKAAQKYNKSEIMKRAWYFYNHRFGCSFSECLKDAWKMAKEAAIDREKREARWAEQKTKNAYRDNFYFKRYNGRNDWKVSYGSRYSAFAY